MGYFSNGTEGMAYEEQYCSDCVHYNQESGCPVLHLHSLYNYTQVKSQDIGNILRVLIPTKDGHNGECSLFYDASNPPVPKEQLPFFGL